MTLFFRALSVVVFATGCIGAPATEAPEDSIPPAEEPASTEPGEPIGANDGESELAPDPMEVARPADDSVPDGAEAEELTPTPFEEPGAGQDYEPTPKAARDLAEELGVRVGNVRDCMQTDAIVRSHIDLYATALVLPSGEVVQPSVAGRGLSQAERQCIATRVSAISLEPLDDPTSQRITTHIMVDLSTPAPTVSGYVVGPDDPVLRNVRDPLPKRPEVAPSGRPIQEPTSRPIQEPTSRPIQEPRSRRVRGPQPRPIDGWDVDESSKDWR